MSTTGGDLRARPTLKSEAAGPQESPGHWRISSEEASGLRPAEMDVSLSQKVMLWWGGGGGAGLVFNPSALSPILWAGVKWQYNAVCSLLLSTNSHDEP